MNAYAEELQHEGRNVYNNDSASQEEITAEDQRNMVNQLVLRFEENTGGVEPYADVLDDGEDENEDDGEGQMDEYNQQQLTDELDDSDDSREIRAASEQTAPADMNEEQLNMRKQFYIKKFLESRESKLQDGLVDQEQFEQEMQQMAREMGLLEADDYDDSIYIDQSEQQDCSS